VCIPHPGGGNCPQAGSLPRTVGPWPGVTIHWARDPRRQVDATSLKKWHCLIITSNSDGLCPPRFWVLVSFGMGIHSSRRSFPPRHGGTGMTRSRK